MKVSEEEVHIAIKRAESLNFNVKETNYALFITTNKANWWIDFSNEDNIKLFHKNMRIYNKKNEKFGEDYHLQRGHFKRVVYAINYIYKHDMDKYTNNEKSKNKRNNDRIEKIFEKIKKNT